jgi:predicted NUDIX family phosphoesterase
MSELIACVPAALLQACGPFQGYKPLDAVGSYAPLFDPDNISFLPRDEVEHDESWKQLIPYNVLRRRLTAHIWPYHYFSYLRGNGQGEKRLHGRRSIGVGGHVNAGDAAQLTSSLFEEGLRRELLEELVITTNDGPLPLSFSPAGLINDDSDSVGRVHLGIVYYHDATDTIVFAREHDIQTPAWDSISVLYHNIDDYEGWSQLLIRHTHDGST